MQGMVTTKDVSNSQASKTGDRCGPTLTPRPEGCPPFGLTPQGRAGPLGITATPGGLHPPLVQCSSFVGSQSEDLPLGLCSTRGCDGSSGRARRCWSSSSLPQTPSLEESNKAPHGISNHTQNVALQEESAGAFRADSGVSGCIPGAPKGTRLT